MNILVVCPHFTPDVAPTGEVMTSIVTELAARGHRIRVVTALPWYRHHRIEPGWEHRLCQVEKTDWGTVERLHPFPTDKTNLVARAVAFGGFTVLATWRAMWGRDRPDVVLAMSPPLVLGIAGWLAARRWRVPLVFNIQDVFPDVAVEVGAITNPTVIGVARWLERFLYLRSAAVTVLSQDLRGNLVEKLRTRLGPRRAGDRVRVIPNFVDTERISPSPVDNAYRREFGLEGKVVVMYAGNLGYSQSVDLLLDAARDLADRPEVAFVVNGGGSGREALVGSARDLPNVVFVGLQPRERLGEVLAAADIHTVPLRAGLARSSVPSKSYSILAAGRPCVASVDPGTEVERILDESGAGISVAPEDREGFVSAVRHLVDHPDERVTRGAAGRRWVEGWASPEAVAGHYEALFEELTAPS